MRWHVMIVPTGLSAFVPIRDGPWEPRRLCSSCRWAKCCFRDRASMGGILTHVPAAQSGLARKGCLAAVGPASVTLNDRMPP